MEGVLVFQILALVLCVLISLTSNLPSTSAQNLPESQFTIPPIPAGINLPQLPNEFAVSGTPPVLSDSTASPGALNFATPFQTTTTTSSSTSSPDSPLFNQFTPGSSLPSGMVRVGVPASEPASEPASAPDSEPTSAPDSEPDSEPDSAPPSVPTTAPTTAPTAAPPSVPTSVPPSVPKSVPTSAPAIPVDYETHPFAAPAAPDSGTLEPTGVPISAPTSPVDSPTQPVAAPDSGTVAPPPADSEDTAVSSSAGHTFRGFSSLVGTIVCFSVINILL